MSKIDWWNDGSKTSDWALRILPILVRQARSQRPVTYGAVAAEVGMAHHRPVQRAAGHIGYALGELAGTRGWRRRPPPPLQALVINRQTGLPGHGVDGFMSHQFQQARTKQQRAAALMTAHASIYAYPFWDEVMTALDVDPASADLEALTEEAANSQGRGGEGPEHKALKEFVAANPPIAGLSAAHPPGATEWHLPSGDAVDVVFASPGRRTAVEVKSHISGRDDVARGIYQCVKYRAVLEAQSAVSETAFDVAVLLVLGGALDARTRELANAFGIPVREKIAPA